jgi:hypothetical protein
MLTNFLKYYLMIDFKLFRKNIKKETAMTKLRYLKIIIFLLIGYQSSFCCTILTSSSSSAVFAGNNEDMCSTNTMIHIIPPSDNKYGRILWGFADDGNCQGGMNEFGLFFDGAGLPHVNMPKQSLPEYDGNFVMEGVLENCKTVEEAIAYLKNYELSFLAFCHILIADGTGDATIMEWGNGKVNFVRKGDKPYLIATNFNQSEPNINSHNCSRFEIASNILEEQPPSIKTFEQVLSHTRQEGNYCTVYSNICDLKSVKMYLYNFHDFSITKEFNLKEEFIKGEQKRMIRSFFPPSFAEKNFRMRYDCISSCDEIPYRNVTFKILCDKAVPSDTIFLRGSAVELGRWNKEGVQLDKVSDNLYTIDVEMKENALFDFELVLNDRNYFPFKKDGNRLKEIDVEIKSDTTLNIDIFEWKKLE